MSVGGNVLALANSAFQNGYGAVLDSGTTFTYLPPPVWAQFEKEVRCRLCFSFGGGQVHLLGARWTPLEKKGSAAFWDREQGDRFDLVAAQRLESDLRQK